jgi:hypothetical protein
MTKMEFYIPVATLGIACATLTGCGSDSNPKQPAVQSAPAPVAVQTAPAPVVYQATLAEGVDFKRDGYPDFLAGVSGVSGKEAWGRWTDGPSAKFDFKHPLPNKFTLVIQSGVFGPNVGQPAIVRVGKLEKSIVPNKPEEASYSLSFEGVDNAKSVEIIPAKPTSPKDLDPKNGDYRKLGLYLITLKIQP